MEGQLRDGAKTYNSYIYIFLFILFHNLCHVLDIKDIVHASACHLERRLETLELQCRKQRPRPRAGGSVQTLPLG